ncbi:hypothetical protein C8E03_11748 [Lachnotalea glycerini]|uniref:Uncharacterized protein n=1 Tax=Lachnotalea glycerini TaxID=1763509 RepID=A0A318EH27_9FIRM|nr:hypothetical protein [Lachnotalea glycerini]PXV85412.1 hypothetical protein C8E03_11748 [Lachnotalea glycerini]
MLKILKKTMALLLSTTLAFSMTSVSFAAEKADIDPYTIEGHYVQELVDLNSEQLDTISLSNAQDLFEEAFKVSASNYTEDEVRLALDGLAFSLKFQNQINEKNASTGNRYTYPALSSSKNGVTYTGDIGVSWVRDTTSGHSPLTLGEILSGTYTLEVDYLTWDTAVSILAASANYNAFQDLKELYATGAAGTALGAFICKALSITGWQATVASVAVGATVGFGWNWLKSIDRSNMYSCFNGMQKDKNKYMKVQFMWSSNMVNKFYSTVSKSKTISNPFSGTYGNWHKGKIGYLYSY